MDSGVYRKWIEDIEALSEAQREEVQKILAGRSSEADVLAALEGGLLADRVCPLGQRQGAVCRGRANGLRRFSCAGCGKTFNALTGTPLANLHYKGRWFDFARSLSEGESVRTSAARCDVAVSTAFRWRHRFLRAIMTDTAPLGGIVEADETYVLESRKGSRAWKNAAVRQPDAEEPERKPRKRGGKATRRGLSSEQVPVLVAADRTGARLAPSCRRSTATPSKTSWPRCSARTPSWSPMAHRSIHLARRSWVSPMRRSINRPVRGSGVNCTSRRSTAAMSASRLSCAAIAASLPNTSAATSSGSISPESTSTRHPARA